MTPKELDEILFKRLNQSQRHHSKGFITAPQMHELRRFAAIISKDVKEYYENNSGRPHV